MDLVAEYLGGGVRFEASPGAVHGLFINMVLGAATVVAPFMAVALLVGVAAQLAQVGFLVTGDPLTPKLSRINPIEGFKRLVSRRALVNFLKSLAKILVVGYIAYLEVRRALDMLPELTSAPLTEAVAMVAGIALRIGLYIGAALLVIAGLDYWYQRQEHERSLRMARQEVKEELKQTEGDPQVRARIRRRQRELASRRMMQEVPTADVIITNPVHLAVALKYDQAVMEAPVVVAKGAGIVARRIKELAEEHGVPIVENVAVGAGSVRRGGAGADDPGGPVPGRGRRAGVRVPHAAQEEVAWRGDTTAARAGNVDREKQRPRHRLGRRSHRGHDGNSAPDVAHRSVADGQHQSGLVDLLLTMNVQHALQFSIFPSVLLVATLFRLGLNVSTTRLILLRADAGSIIDAFGSSSSAATTWSVSSCS